MREIKLWIAKLTKSRKFIAHHSQPSPTHDSAIKAQKAVAEGPISVGNSGLLFACLGISIGIRRLVASANHLKKTHFHPVMYVEEHHVIQHLIYTALHSLMHTMTTKWFGLLS